MFVLPQILLVGDTIIEKTAFVMNMPVKPKSAAGLMRVEGMVRGNVNGVFTGYMRGIVRGNLNAFVENGELTEIDSEAKLIEENLEIKAVNTDNDISKDEASEKDDVKTAENMEKKEGEDNE